ncbi:hypothetical protein Smp_160300 [Schistosoma mansoni]|uniref:hypothetical protein n=1 Tax=Schistosoma mansoni TaxID=6183 RepID=UPI00022DCC9C|nr:hypothetical protein Smp_160300 [Schistosoma mansoni]|eukprot:XP_018655618.1 hypothetical protein Smp_160300 [Schistosoma mansoni]
MHKFRIGKVDNLWTQRVRYNLERFKEASINQRQYSDNEDIFTLNIVLTVAGAIALPFTLFNLLCEVKMVFGGGEFRYKQADLVLASGILYNCWWSLFLTLMWISSSLDYNILNSTNTTLSNVKTSIYLITLTKLDEHVFPVETLEEYLLTTIP